MLWGSLSTKPAQKRQKKSCNQVRYFLSNPFAESLSSNPPVCRYVSALFPFTRASFFCQRHEAIHIELINLPCVSSTVGGPYAALSSMCRLLPSLCLPDMHEFLGIWEDAMQKRACFTFITPNICMQDWKKSSLNVNNWRRSLASYRASWKC